MSANVLFTRSTLAHRLRCGAALVACLAALGLSNRAKADDLNAQIAAGEFAPAVAAAQQAPGQQRDAMLGQIAQAQAAAGAPAAAVKTVGQIGNDKVRADILAQPGGAGGGAGAGQNQQANNAQHADFQPLQDLITQTVATKTWQENGGNGTLSPFPTGVSIDPSGMLQPLMKNNDDLAKLRATSQSGEVSGGVHHSSPLRMVSLTKLEKQLQLNRALGQGPDDAMQNMAGLRRVQYVFVYPETNDIVLAGPAGDWTVGPENRIVSVETGEPVVHLDDLVVVLRHMMKSADAMFGCRIDPRPEGLKKVQEFIAKWSGRAVQVEDRKGWVEALRQQLGKQVISIDGSLDPQSGVARTIVEADYRMKCVGMGIEPGVPGVKSYLSLIKGNPPAMGVLRWWFNLNYDAIETSSDRMAFAIRGQGVKVESENEHLTRQGEQVHTGDSEPLNREFAESFTKHFGELCAKYPVYAELRNICDLALVAALIREESLADKADWHMTYFGNPSGYAAEHGAVPKEVDSIANFRVVNQHTFVTGVSGGVRVAPNALVQKSAIKTEDYPKLKDQRPYNSPKASQGDRWWWD